MTQLYVERSLPSSGRSPGHIHALFDDATAHALVTRLPETVPWTDVLGPAERRRLLDEVSAAAGVTADLGAHTQLDKTWQRWRETARSRAEGTVSGHQTRPVAIPDDVDDPGVAKASGRVVLPLHVHWSGPPYVYDLTERRDRAVLYEEVLSEGTEDDVRAFIDVDELIGLWDDLVLAPRVRRAWAEWLRRRRGIDLAC